MKEWKVGVLYLLHAYAAALTLAGPSLAWYGSHVGS
jgi:hypothetical protein